MKLLLIVLAFVVWMGDSNAQAVSLYVGRGAGTTVNDSHYYYSGSRWPEMTAIIDTAFDTITVAADLSDLDAMLTHDRLWVDSRSFYGAPLSAIEIDNIRAFLATGRRAVLMGERGVDWSTQILSIVGGTWAGEGLGLGVANALPIMPALTDGVGSIDFSQNGFGLSSGGMPLFNRPWSALWGNNALTILDAVVFSQLYISSHDRYGHNVVQWLAIPEPSSFALIAFSTALALQRSPARTRPRSRVCCLRSC